MFRVNKCYEELPGNYLFADIARKLALFQAAHPGCDLIKMGIGDVTQPLAPAVVRAMRQAVDEMGEAGSFRGYGPEQGYEFLRERIRDVDYRERGIDIAADEIFVSDGAKCDVGNIQELFDRSCRAAIPDPVYPVYRDSNILAGRGDGLVYLPCRPDNGFLPEFPAEPVDLIYLCSPNNPTGAAFGRAELTEFVAAARRMGALILFDSAYEAYVRDDDVPRSIYEIPGAQEQAIEFRSFSKTAGFTGTRCAYCVVPKALPGNLNAMWRRRQTTKFNGVSYIVQRGAEAALSDEGRRETAAQIDYYRENAENIRRILEKSGYIVYGGRNAPYIWWRLPGGMSSAEFFDRLLAECQVVGTPGAGFGAGGEGYFRLTTFGDRERTLEAMERISAWKIN